MSRDDPVAFVKYIAQTVHQAYHKDDGSWHTCKKDICASTRKWIKDFLSDEKMWVTASGKIMPIKEMDDAHLINAYKHITKKVSAIVFRAHSDGLVDIKPSDVIAASFPDAANLKTEILRRKSLEIESYKGTRNLDL